MRQKTSLPVGGKQVKTDFETTAVRVSFVSIAVNLLLSVGKLLAGVFAHSGAMVSDAVHSASDVFSSRSKHLLPLKTFNFLDFVRFFMLFKQRTACGGGCGCPVGTSAQQKHRPRRQPRLGSLIRATGFVSPPTNPHFTG